MEIFAAVSIRPVADRLVVEPGRFVPAKRQPGE